MHDRFWISASKEVYFGRFRQAEGKQLQNCGAPRHGFGDALHEGGFLRTGEKPLAFSIWVGVDDSAGVVKQAGRVLYLIENDGKTEALQERAGIAEYAVLDVRVLE